MARPEIKTVADLKGKRIGTASLQAGESWITRDWLAAQGLASEDWELVSVGTTPLKLAALTNGSIAAAIVFPPTSLDIEAMGYTTLYRYYQGKPFPPVIYTVNRKWAAEQDHGLRLSRALRRAHRWMLDPANREAAIDVLQGVTKFKLPVLSAAYDLFIAKVKLYNDDDAVDIAGVNNEIAVMEENGALPKGTTVAPELYLLPKELGGLYR
jgi:NitT/TauT family transport system substrate-binding protein